jgi:hypothetical protein
MTRSARSIFVFGVYLVVTGVVLFALPNVLLAVLGLPRTDEPWIRVAGIPVGVLGAFHIAAARAELVPFFRYTVWGRPIVLVGIGALVLVRLAPPILLLFGLVDVAGAMWTRVTLREGAA